MLSRAHKHKLRRMVTFQKDIIEMTINKTNLYLILTGLISLCIFAGCTTAVEDQPGITLTNILGQYKFSEYYSYDTGKKSKAQLDWISKIKKTTITIASNLYSCSSVATWENPKYEIINYSNAWHAGQEGNIWPEYYVGLHGFQYSKQQPIVLRVTGNNNRLDTVELIDENTILVHDGVRGVFMFKKNTHLKNKSLKNYFSK